MLHNFVPDVSFSSYYINTKKNFPIRGEGWGETLFNFLPSPQRSVGSVQDMRTGGLCFEPPALPIFFQGLMIVTWTGFIPLSLLSVSTIVIWESSQWLGKNIVQSKPPGKHG